MNKINKTIYFLGAGFSKDAGGPIQNELIKTILSDEFINYFNDPKTKKAYDAFIGFLNDELLISENNYEYVFLVLPVWKAEQPSNPLALQFAHPYEKRIPDIL